MLIMGSRNDELGNQQSFLSSLFALAIFNWPVHLSLSLLPSLLSYYLTRVSHCFNTPVTYIMPT